MTVLLALDASTSTGSVALFRGGQLCGERTVAMKGATEERLMPAVAELVNAESSWAAIRQVVVGGGPGSFTSLRIAASIAKGVVFALGAELLVVPSLALMCPERAEGGARFLTALDAMRGEFFVSLIEVDATGVIGRMGGVSRVPVATLVEAAANANAILIGPSGPMQLTGIPHARRAGALVHAGLATRVDLATWEPDYGRLAEAQVKWEAEHRRPLGGGGPMSGAATAVVRPAEPNDLDAVVAIEHAAFSDAWSRPSFAQLIGRKEVQFSVVVREGIVVGYAVAYVAADEAELMNFAIATGARGLGVGRRLLFSVLGGVREAGADWIWLEVRDSNVAARALYDRSGFAEVGIRKHYYEKPVEDAIVMRRQTAVQSNASL